MSKIINFNQEAKNKLKEGIDKVNNAVSVTMGPYGRNVLIEKEYGKVQSTKDGVTVAKEIELEDPIENMAATVIKQAAQKTVEGAGDGTTTATVLAHSIASQALELTKDPKINVTQVKKGIEYATEEIIKTLKSNSINIENENQIKQVAILSSNGDEEIGNLVSEAIDKVGRDGIVTVEESRTGETYLDVVEGMQIDRGYKSPYMVTNNDTMTAILNDVLILLIDGKLNAVKDLLPILEFVSQENKSLLIIAEDIEGETLGTLVVNKIRNILKVVAVKAPDFGERRTLILEDIATITGGTVISQQKGHYLDSFNKEWFGKARTVTVGKETTTIIDGKGDKDQIKTRILNLKNQIDKSKSPYEIEKLQERVAKMIGGVAVINIGGGTEIEMKEKKDRLDDALQATKAAIEEGILPGAGVALINARRTISEYNENMDDFEKGKLIVYTACRKPFNQILQNAGEDYEKWFNLLNDKNKTMVPNIEENQLVDAYTKGIIDPTKVVRLAIQNASTAAITLLMTEATIYQKSKNDKNKEDFGMSNLDL